MSHADDYGFEMRKSPPLDDAAVEAFFAGRALPDPADAELTLLAQSARALARRTPPAPKGALADLLASGLIVDQAAPGMAAPATAKRRKYRMAVSQLLAALAAKLGALGLAAKTGLVAALAAAVFSAAGAAGVLPAPVQNGVAGLIDSISPLHLPTDATSHTTGSGSSTVHNKTSVPPSTPGAKGLARANQTPAKGHVPTTTGSGNASGSHSAHGAGSGGH